MNRRKFIMGTGATAAGGASLLGSGAFTSVAAEREISVAVADDTDAFLRLAPCPDSPNGGYVDNSNGQLSIDLSGENSNDDPSGSGVNTNALSRFDSVFEIANQGTQDVCVDFAVEVPRIPDGANVPEGYDFGPGDPAVVFYRGSDRGRYVINNRLDTDRDGAIKLPIDNGSSECIGFEVRAFGFETGENLFGGVDLTIRADADAECTVPEEGDVADPTPTGPTDGLVGYWPLDDLSDETAVDVADDNDGDVVGGVATEPGRVGNAATFGDGTNDYVEVGTGETFGLPQFTVAAWAKVTDTDSGLRTVFARQNPDANDPFQNRTFVLWFDDADEFFGAEVITARTAESDGDLQDVTAGDQDYTDGEWHHLVATAESNGELVLYVDGESKGSQSVDGSLYTGAGQTWIGLSPGQDRPLDGAVDDVRIYDRVLSADEVGTLYDSTAASGEV